MITELQPNQIFVYGSNANGIHAGGAALQARKFGALYGAAEGLTGGQTYGIVTLGHDMNKVPLSYIREQAEQLKFIAQANPDYEFLLTPVGTGIANFTYEEISPLFENLPVNIKKVGWNHA